MFGNRQIKALKGLQAQQKRCGLMASMRKIALLCIGCCLCLTGCRIEPPLHLPDDIPQIDLGITEVETSLSIIWNINEDWRSHWWYGWDDEDIRILGDTVYPNPNYFEGRFFYLGEVPDHSQWLNIYKESIYGVTFRRRFEFGYHDMVLWSNIESADGTQVLVIDENDLNNIYATTTHSRLSYEPVTRSNDIHNSPEIFYSGEVDNIYISRDTLDYDYFDYARNVWVKEVPATLYPLVYIYLVQVVVYNNNRRIVYITDKATISSLADAVNVRSGCTSDVPTTIAFPMRFKTGLTARDGREADIFGGKFTTFGLCDMRPWAESRFDDVYSGSRADLPNYFMMSLNFNNATDSVYAFDITRQLQQQPHGGIVTIEIDADTLQIPTSSRNGSTFDPYIEPSDSIENEFKM